MLPAGAAGKFVDRAVADLKRMLETMTGKSFEAAKGAGSAIRLLLSTSTETPDSIRQALASKGIESFVICGARDGLTIVANDPHTACRMESITN